MTNLKNPLRALTALRAAAALLMLLAALASTAPAFAADGVVNVNSADEDQLALLPRVGPALAGRIIEYRETNGEFTATEELMLVRGIGEKTFELMEPWVAVEGETTLDGKVRTAEARERLTPTDAEADDAGGR